MSQTQSDTYQDVRFECDKAVFLHRRALKISSLRARTTERKRAQTSWESAGARLSNGGGDLDTFRYFCTSTHLLSLGGELQRYAESWKLPARYWKALTDDLTSPPGSRVNLVLRQLSQGI